MISLAKTWLFDIISYFRFVMERRIDPRHSLLPSRRVVLVGIFVCFLIIYGLFLWADPIALDWIRNPRRRFHPIFQYVTILGKVDWILFTTGFIMVILSLFNAKRFTGYKNIVWHRIFLNAYFTFTTIAFSGILGNLLKNIIGRARPFFTPEGNIWLSLPFEHRYYYGSFPSGHATTGGAIAVVLALLFPRWRWFFILTGIFVAITRPVLGVHFPSDVAAGLFFGGGFAWFYARVFARKRLLFIFNQQSRLVLRGEGHSRGKFTSAKSELIDTKLSPKTTGETIEK